MFGSTDAEQAELEQRRLELERLDAALEALRSKADMVGSMARLVEDQVAEAGLDQSLASEASNFVQVSNQVLSDARAAQTVAELAGAEWAISEALRQVSILKANVNQAAVQQKAARRELGLLMEHDARLARQERELEDSIQAQIRQMQKLEELRQAPAKAVEERLALRQIERQLRAEKKALSAERVELELLMLRSSR